MAKIERVEGPVKVDRENAQRYVVIQSNVRDRDLVGFVEEAQAKVAQQIKLPANYRIVWGGQFENQQRAAQRLVLVVPVALGLIFLLLFSTFGSVRQATLVLTNIPFALVGGVFALLAARQYLSVPASVGFIALLGIAVLNGVVMLTYFNQLLAQGLSLEQVVREGAKLTKGLIAKLKAAGVKEIPLAPSELVGRAVLTELVDSKKNKIAERNQRLTAEIIEALLESDIDALCFTGGAETGRKVMLFSADMDLSNPGFAQLSQLRMQVIDLDKDVVASTKEVPGSNAFVTKDWVGRLFFNCILYGERIVRTPEEMNRIRANFSR